MRVHIIGCKACNLDENCEYRKNIHEASRGVLGDKHMSFLCDAIRPVFRSGDMITYRQSYKTNDGWAVTYCMGEILNFSRKYVAYLIKTNSGNTIWKKPSYVKKISK